ncbi:MAG TPA: sucrase ferredoxin [Gaiellaceae bacterium]|nr:sucrase ferredoxin [Gaiellaceae bacterium]
MAVSVKRALCADVSEQASEPLAATASRVDRWLLVEYRGLWDRDVLGGSLLSAELKEHLRDQLAQLGHARLLFIKRPERRSHARRMLYVGSSRPGEERLFALEFDHHDDLLGYDFAGALLDGGTPGVPVEHPIFVVCTHGKRDRCCAKYGRPLYDSLKRKVDPAWVWQSTHVGGDRFAGNVVVLPEGLYFGRLDDPDLDPLLDEYFDRRIYLDRYRGRSAHTFAVQAAERALREAEGLRDIDAVTLESVESRGDGWTVTLRANGTSRSVDVESELAEPVYLTCSAVTPQRPRRYSARLR